jgi:putative DNA primase/helicase
MQNNTSAERYAPDLPGEDLPLSAEHRRELFRDSAIDVEVARERGYYTVDRPNPNAKGGETIPGIAHFGSYATALQSIGFPSWATREGYFFPGLWVPGWDVRGRRFAGQWKPKSPVSNRDGKKMKYASARGSAARLDVHPRWTYDRGREDPALVPWIRDPARRLWITEGAKKADSLTSKDEVTIALSGVFNWRNAHGTLGDWEDVVIKGREVVICFDADTRSKAPVALAMQRLGKWLQSKGAAKVWYCIVPNAVTTDAGVTAVKGVDDYFAAGGSLKELERTFEAKPPKVASTDDFFTDARLAETLAAEVLDGSYLWAAGLDWLAFDGRVWRESHEVTVIEAVRQWVRDNFAEAAKRLQENDADAGTAVEGWRGMLSANRMRSVLSLARGIVERKAEDFDAEPDLLNMPSGVFDFTTGETLPHSPDFLFTKITSGSYRPDYTHPDWDRALEVLPADTMEWFAIRCGQAITGHTTPDGIVPIMKGGGENGKGLLMTDGLLPAFGGYAAPASPKLFASAKNEHSTERAELRGQRLVIAEELTEGRSIDVTALKQIADVGRITARRTHKDNMTFDASHSIFATTNYTPVIAETDHGTWRRLALVVFPFTFVKPGQRITDPDTEKRGDPTLKARIKAGKAGQHDAAVTWAIEGALRWYRNTQAIEEAHTRGEEPPPSVLLPPERVAEDTLTWRKEADRILAFWEECLVPDPSAIVLASEVTDVFNEWLASGGHGAWAKETFRPRFAEHMETKKHRAVMKRKARLRDVEAHVMRKPHAGGFAHVVKPIPAQADAWYGFRYADGLNAI